MSDGPGFRLNIIAWSKGHPCGVAASTLDEIGPAATTWVHIVAEDRSKTAEFLRDRFGFHELEVEDALTEGERPHLHENEDHLFFTAPAVRIEDVKLFFTEVGFFLSKSRLVSVSSEPVAWIEEWSRRCQNKAFGTIHDASRLAYLLLDALVDAYYPAMDMLEDQAEALEDLVFRGQAVGVKDLLRLKRRLLETRRRLSPFRDILNGLLRHDLPFVAKADRVYFQDVYDHVLRVLEHTDLNRDILTSLLDANLATVSNRLNQIMRVLTVASVVLMSMALVAGIYGMNFKHMPELGWPMGYPLSIGSMLVIALIELWVFRKMKWL